MYRAIASLSMLLLAGSVWAQDPAGRIHGRIITEDGSTYEGLIRWDRNEVSWVDILDGTKHIYNEEESRQHRRRKISIFGYTIYEEGPSSRTRESGIRFGEIATLEPLNNSRALLTLHSGQRVEFSGGSTDIGSDIREIIVEDERQGEIELDWRDVDIVEFSQAPNRAESIFGNRIYGTVTSRGGYTFTGAICWDVDEVLGDDELDGTDEDDRKRKIRFENIASLHRQSSSSTLVVLTNGEEAILRGTNDVNDGNRGILILDPGIGQVRMDWDDFEEVIFEQAPSYVTAYEDFLESYELYGTVFTRDGDAFEGFIRWDNDEQDSWELLNGDADDIEFSVVFSNIRSIERLSSHASEVILFDGRTFELRDSNDVDSDNDGIYIIDESGDTVRIDWRDFERVVFDKP